MTEHVAFFVKEQIIEIKLKIDAIRWGPLSPVCVCVYSLHTKLTVILIIIPELQCLQDLSGFHNSHLSVSAVCTTTPFAFT